MLTWPTRSIGIVWECLNNNSNNMDVVIKDGTGTIPAEMTIENGVIIVSPKKEEKKGKVTDRVKTYEDACKELGRQPYNEDQLMKLGLTKNDLAYHKMVVIVEALNEGWEPDVCDRDVYRWFPWFATNGSPCSFAFHDSLYDDAIAHAGSGSRLALKSEELADYCGKQFVELWKEMLL